MHAFWLILTYDLLEDRPTDDVITENFSLCFSKMAECFENLEGILLDWVNEDVEKKSLAETVDKFQKQEEEKWNMFLYRKWLQVKRPLNIRHKMFLYYIKQIENVIRTKCDKNNSDTLGYRLVCHFFVLTRFLRLWSVIYYWTDTQQHGIYLLNRLESQS